MLLPFELCVLRQGETFIQLTARAKRCGIGVARKAKVECELPVLGLPSFALLQRFFELVQAERVFTLWAGRQIVL